MQFIDYYYYEYQTAPSPFASFLSLLLGVAGIVACWLLFKKAGKPGWASIVPFYNVYTIFEITWGNGWRFLMLLIPIYNIVLGIQTCIRLAKAFGKSGGFAAGLVFLPYIFIPLLAFGKETYQGVPVKEAPYQNNPYQQGGYSQQPQQFQYAAPPQQPQQYAAPQQPVPQQSQQYTAPQQPAPQQPASQQPEQTAAAPAFCPSCGVKSSGEKFCQNCGAPLH